MYDFGDDVISLSPQFRHWSTQFPNAKQPASYEDAYDFVVHLHANAEKYGIDPKKIGAEGFSGGGFVLAGLGYELAKANKSHLVHSLFFLEPMLDDTILNIDPAEASQNEEWERRYTRSLLEGHAFNLDK